MERPTAHAQIENTLAKMAEPFGEPVFDEWFLVAKAGPGWEVLSYEGPRPDEYQAAFTKDMASLRNTLKPGRLELGDFAFSHEGVGSGFDAHMVAGPEVLVLFNNTGKSTGDITGDPRWKISQIHFNELLETFLSDPVL
ncbi:hypothetical protein P3T73_07450 [Kiritimatiellota bacterium B12222]|nr:hypothetical protein P3T73_07450 [Kiritimatiellota bacterium B12222]